MHKIPCKRPCKKQYMFGNQWKTWCFAGFYSKVYVQLDFFSSSVSFHSQMLGATNFWQEIILSLWWLKKIYLYCIIDHDRFYWIVKDSHHHNIALFFLLLKNQLKNCKIRNIQSIYVKKDSASMSQIFYWLQFLINFELKKHKFYFFRGSIKSLTFWKVFLPHDMYSFANFSFYLGICKINTMISIKKIFCKPNLDYLFIILLRALLVWL